MLEITKKLLNRKLNFNNPKSELIEILRSAIELLSLPENDFCWSFWEDKTKVIEEINKLIKLIEKDSIPERLEVNLLFAPTGPIQEVSMSSGWSAIFLKLAEKYDEIEKLIW